MRSFSSLAQFDAFLDERIAAVARGFTAELSEIGEIQKRDAQDRLGVYQGREGPFPAWQSLAQSTKAQREALGYTADEPLLREGDLRDHISLTALPWSVTVGIRYGVASRDGKATMGDIAMWQEFGAARLDEPWIPPRPFIGPALYTTLPETIEVAAIAVLTRATGLPATAFVTHSAFSRAPASAAMSAAFALGQSQTGGS